jgi:hypothetical protein
MSLFSPSTPENAVGTLERQVRKTGLLPYTNAALLSTTKPVREPRGNDFTASLPFSTAYGKLN